MPLQGVRFVVIMLAALSLSFGVAHLLELPARLGWDQYLWVGATVQGGLFRAGGPIGVLIQFAAGVALVVLALLLRRHRLPGFGLTVAAAILYGLGLLLWWALVYPADVELAKWVNGPVPPDWTRWRKTWELGQAANGLAQLAGFAALVASILTAPRGSRS